MRVRQTIWGGLFIVTVIFTVALMLDILTNQGNIASAIYTETQMGVTFPVEALFIAVLGVPVIAAISGIMFLIYFIKSRKQRN